MKKQKKVKFDDCYLTPHESKAYQQINESFEYDNENLSESVGISIEDARKILTKRIQKIISRHERE